MLGIYKILILDTSVNPDLNELKKSVYNVIYMDNGGYTCNTKEELIQSYSLLKRIFRTYNFELQQFCSNLQELQGIIDKEEEIQTPMDVKLFGMSWNRETDTLAPYKLNLNDQATTKREVLSTLNEVYDIYGIYAPILLRAKLFLQNISGNKVRGFRTSLIF